MRCPTASRTRATQEPYNVVRLMAGVHRPIVLPPWRRARTRQGVARCVASCERRTGRCRPLPACRQILRRPDPSPGRAQGATHRHCRRAGCADRRCGPSRAGRRCTATLYVRLAGRAHRRRAPRRGAKSPPWLARRPASSRYGAVEVRLHDCQPPARCHRFRAGVARLFGGAELDDLAERVTVLCWCCLSETQDAAG